MELNCDNQGVIELSKDNKFIKGLNTSIYAIIIFMSQWRRSK